ncbi:type II secretion system minor pseudopilin GspJ [Teredinibacter sp. KSP-S5-2]|uniref:type II secretion system minor pseudopilin GspJ n=1 Tax=Teredinibacter sp. KSP-S5-2 TaxID=3034506 RepID=UPI0029349AA5|nr:type II secretion system minor pseudopilin GspJ [Teredinibacter sp. KSP-S5-2]WNO08974.1 type II secretion system minor pseudopilin GspJ [Teredinibacter sp. KSP-S5-2]
MKKAVRYPNKQLGMTLIEVIVAVSIMAVIAVTSFQTLTVAIDASELSRNSMKRLGRIDRTWLLLEKDLNHAVGHPRRGAYGDKIKAFEAPFEREYIFQVFRAGRSNPLYLPRTELARVGYRLEDDVLWRDMWVDPGNIEADPSTSQKLLDKVEQVEIHMLPWSANDPSMEGTGWSEKWPISQAEDLPAAVRIRITLEDRGEITRLFLILKEDF